jgi:hypothetical protein
MIMAIAFCLFAGKAHAVEMAPATTEDSKKFESEVKEGEKSKKERKEQRKKEKEERKDDKLEQRRKK